MKKYILALILISITMTLFADEKPLFFKEFITINNAFIGKSVIAEQTLTTYDLEIGIEYLMDCQVLEQGNIVVNAIMFSELMI